MENKCKQIVWYSCKGDVDDCLFYSPVEEQEGWVVCKWQECHGDYDYECTNKQAQKSAK